MNQKIIGLSPRELEVIREMIAEKPIKEIAAELDISQSTARRHLAKAREKMGMQTNVGLAVQVIVQELVEP